MFNARSLISKMEDFLDTIDIFKPDIIGVMESWANEDVLDSELAVVSYNFKKGSCNKSEYYRPVSLTIQICRIF